MGSCRAATKVVESNYSRARHYKNAARKKKTNFFHLCGDMTKENWPLARVDLKETE